MLIIGQYCIIEDGCELGEGVTIGHYVILKSGTVVGDGCVIENYVHSSGQNEIGPRTRIKPRVSIGRRVRIGADCFLGPHSVILYQTHELLARETVIEDRVFLGTGAVVNPGVRICAGAVIGALALVTRAILEPGVYAGIPARRIK